MVRVCAPSSAPMTMPSPSMVGGNIERKPRQSLVGLAMCRIGLVGAAGQHDAAVRADPALVGDDAGDAAVLDHQPLGLGVAADRHAARQQQLDEMGDDADAAGADFLCAALRHDVLRPIVDVGDAAPLEQLGAVDLDRRVAGREDRVLPFAEVGRRDELGVEAAAFRHRARRHAEIMVGQARARCESARPGPRRTSAPRGRGRHRPGAARRRSPRRRRSACRPARRRANPCSPRRASGGCCRSRCRPSRTTCRRRACRPSPAAPGEARLVRGERGRDAGDAGADHHDVERLIPGHSIPAARRFVVLSLHRTYPRSDARSRMRELRDACIIRAAVVGAAAVAGARMPAQAQARCARFRTGR